MSEAVNSRTRIRRVHTDGGGADHPGEEGTRARNYQLLPSVRADLLVELGRADEARLEFERAASLTSDDAERTLLPGRAAQL